MRPNDPCRGRIGSPCIRPYALVGEPRVSRGRDDRELLRPQGGATLVWDRRNRARL